MMEYPSKQAKGYLSPLWADFRLQKKAKWKSSRTIHLSATFMVVPFVVIVHLLITIPAVAIIHPLRCGCWNEREGQQGAVRSLLIFANPPYMGTLQHLYTYTPIYTFTQYTPLQLYGATSTFDTLHCNEVNSIALPGRRK